MSKGFKRLLVLGAAIGAAAAGTYYFLNKQKADDDFDDFDDFEDDEFDDDLEEDTSERSYVSLTPAKEEASKKEAVSKEDSVDIPEAKTETIEEFFDEDDA